MSATAPLNVEGTRDRRQMLRVFPASTSRSSAPRASGYTTLSPRAFTIR